MLWVSCEQAVLSFISVRFHPPFVCPTGNSSHVLRHLYIEILGAISSQPYCAVVCKFDFLTGNAFIYFTNVQVEEYVREDTSLW